jgi:hypothetical protein
MSPILLLLVRVLLVLDAATAKPDLLQLSAVVSDADDNARIECWQFEDAPFSRYPTVGKAMYLADVSNVTYVVLPLVSKEGLHRPPHPMLFILVSGEAHVTLPDLSDELWLSEGVDDVIIAADTRGVGHYTEYPSNKETVALQLPFANGQVPRHAVIGQGACSRLSKLLRQSQGEASQPHILVAQAT